MFKIKTNKIPVASFSLVNGFVPEETHVDLTSLAEMSNN